MKPKHLHLRISHIASRWSIYSMRSGGPSYSSSLARLPAKIVPTAEYRYFVCSLEVIVSRLHSVLGLCSIYIHP